MSVEKLIYVKCCYCGSRQLSAPPPCLTTCFHCKRSFRVLHSYSGVRPIELTSEAKKALTSKGVA